MARNVARPCALEEIREAVDGGRVGLDGGVAVLAIRGSRAVANWARFQSAISRLVAVGVAAVVIDGAEDRGRVVGVHEGAGTVVDGFARDRDMLSVFMTPWTKPTRIQ